MSKWNEKRAKQAEFAMNKMLDSGQDSIDFEGSLDKDIRDAAMGSKSSFIFLSLLIIFIACSIFFTKILCFTF